MADARDQNIRRYHLLCALPYIGGHDYAEEKEDADGYWVRYSDHSTAIAKLKIACDVAQALREESDRQLVIARDALAEIASISGGPIRTIAQRVLEKVEEN